MFYAMPTHISQRTSYH